MKRQLWNFEFELKRLQCKLNYSAEVWKNEIQFSVSASKNALDICLKEQKKIHHELTLHTIIVFFVMQLLFYQELLKNNNSCSTKQGCSTVGQKLHKILAIFRLSISGNIQRFFFGNFDDFSNWSTLGFVEINLLITNYWNPSKIYLKYGQNFYTYFVSKWSTVQHSIMPFRAIFWHFLAVFIYFLSILTQWQERRIEGRS